MSQLILPFFNLSILLGVLFYYLRTPLREFVVARHKTLLEELKVTQAQLHNAQIQYEDFSAKLKALDAEVAALHSQMKKDREIAKAEILREGQKVAEYVVKEAQIAANNLYLELKAQLSKELGAKVIYRAEELLFGALRAEDRARLNKDFVQQLGDAR